MQHVDRPLQLGVLLATACMPSGSVMAASTITTCQPQNVKHRELAGANSGTLAGSLHDVVGSGEERTAAEGEDHGVGVQRAQPPVAEPRQCRTFSVGPRQLRGDQHAHQSCRRRPRRCSPARIRAPGRRRTHAVVVVHRDLLRLRQFREGNCSWRESSVGLQSSCLKCRKRFPAPTSSRSIELAAVQGPALESRRMMASTSTADSGIRRYRMSMASGDAAEAVAASSVAAVELAAP